MKLTEEKKLKIIAHVTDTYNSYHELLKEWKDRMLEVDKACKKFSMDKTHSWNTSFKVNKAHEIENKVTPRIVSNKPRWIVTPASDEFDAGDSDLPPEEMMQKLGMYSEYSLAIGDYLNQIFQMDDIREVQKIGAKNLVRHGLNWWKVCYRYKIDREGKTVEKKEYDDEGNEVMTMGKEVKENVVGEYPTIEIISWKDIYYDPRYTRLEDMPSIIDVKERVRLSYFTQTSKKFMDVDRLLDYVMCDYEADPHSYADRIYAITGIRTDLKGKVDKNHLNVKKYYGYYDLNNEDGRDERLYEFWVVNDSILVYAEEITYLPYEDVKCFEDTETHIATGFIEPILGLQDELNFKKNSASDYINQALNRTWIWSPNSGVNPKQLIFGPGAIIPTTRSGEEALRNLVELPLRQLPPQYFQEQNDFERQIQSMSFTIDTSTNNSNEALTNTATGIKVRVFESNNVINQVRENFEASLTRLAYKLLHETYNNLDTNIIIKRSDGKGYWEIHKEAMRDALRRYNIGIETGTSTYDGIEQKRADAIARWNLGQQASSAGVPVDLKELYIGIMSTFEGVNINKLVKPIKNPMEEQPMMGGVSGMPSSVPGMPGTPGVPKPKQMKMPIQQPLKNPQGIGGINGVSM